MTLVVNKAECLIIIGTTKFVPGAPADLDDKERENPQVERLFVFGDLENYKEEVEETAVAAKPAAPPKQLEPKK